MNNKDRINPFRTQNRSNFPPLDEFFDSGAASPPLPTATAVANVEEDAFSTSFSPEQSFCSRTSTSGVSCHDFSIDMSIGGRAAMAEHRHHVRKYGIDGLVETAADTSSGEKSSSLSEGDDWDRLMDDSYSHVSFSSTAIFAARKAIEESNLSRVSRATGESDSPDESYADDASSSFFDKSVVRVLMTPEKIRSKMNQADLETGNGVTLQRGRNHDSNDSIVDDCVECNSNVSSTCSGVEGMFHAALRFQDDFDLQSSSFVPDEDSSFFAAGKSNGNRNTSVSFAADTSFATHDSRFGSRRKKKQPRATLMENNELEEKMPNGELNFLFGSPISKRNKDDSFCGDSSFLASPMLSPAFSRANSAISKVASPSSSAFSTPRASPNRERSTTPLRSGRRSLTTEDNQSTTTLSFLGLSPIDSQVGGAPYERHARSVSLPLEFDDCTKKKLFDDEPEHISLDFAISHDHDSIEVLPKKIFDKSATNITMKSEDSYYSQSSTAQSSSEEMTTPVYRTRAFGTNSANWLNSKANPLLPKRQHAVSTRKNPERNDRIFEENRRGVRLSRASKLKELGLERAYSVPDNYYNRRNDF